MLPKLFCPEMACPHFSLIAVVPISILWAGGLVHIGHPLKRLDFNSIKINVQSSHWFYCVLILCRDWGRERLWKTFPTVTCYLAVQLCG